jgi:hypothetical protein
MPTDHSELVGTTGKGGKRIKWRAEEPGDFVEKSV